MRIARLLLWGLALAGFCLCSGASRPASAASVRIAVVADGSGPLINDFVRGVEHELRPLLGPKGDFSLVRDPAFVGQRTRESVRRAFRTALERRDVSMVLCAGVLASSVAADPELALSKPVVGGLYLDGELFPLPGGAGLSPGKRNLNQVVVTGQVRRDLRALRNMMQGGSVGVLLDRNVVREVPGVRQRMPALAAEAGLDAFLLPAGGDVQEVLAGVPQGTDWVYVTPLPGLSGADLASLYATLQGRGTAVFSFQGREEVERGAAAGMFPDMSQRLYRRIALNMQLILDGAEPETLPTRLSGGNELFLNRGALRAAGQTLPVDVLLQAGLLGEEPAQETGPVLTLEGAMRLAVERNLAVRAQGRTTDAAEFRARRAAGAFLPRVEANMAYSRIDQDRSAAQFGLHPWQRTTAGGSVRQMLFDDSIITRYRQAGALAESAGFREASGRMDAMLRTGLAYLKVLSARALLEIERENLDLTRENLEMARVRRSAGVSGPEDVLRWETLLAGTRSSLLRREADLRTAWLGLNQAMNMPQETRWNMETWDETRAVRGFLDGALVRAVRTLEDLDRVREFSLTRVDDSPAVKALERRIRAQRLELARVKRSFYLPRVAGQLSYDHELDVHRSGTMPAYESAYEASTDTWSVGVEMTLPLFSGGSRVAEKNEAKAELENFLLQRERLRETMSRETLARINDLYHSYPNIELTAVGADRARRNLEVVREKYGAGEVSILSLLDAQSQAIAREQNAALAVYGFVADLLRYQRAVSWMQAGRSEEEQREFVHRLENWNKRSEREVESGR
jgi:outer membrane protein TolC